MLATSVLLAASLAGGVSHAFDPLLIQSKSQLPPIGLSSNHKPRLLEWRSHPPQLGIIEHWTGARMIEVHWGAAPDPKQPGRVLFRKDQEYVLSMYPTDTALLDSDTLVVAGKRKGNYTTIERWEFEWPDPLPHPSYDDETGKWSYEIALPELTKRTEVYGESTPGRIFVRHLLPVLGLSEEDASVFVQFHDSGDIYILDATDGALTLISGSSKAGVLPVIPELANPYDRSWKANHRGQGYVYVLSVRDRTEPTDPPTLVLQDTDRDGDLDNHVLIPADGWADSLYGDPANYFH